MTVDQRIIVPLDVSSASAALDLVDAIPEVSFWKVGLELFVSSGPGLIQELKARQKRIFLDLKFHDIPNTMAGACAAAGRYGVDLLTIHAAAGQEAMEVAQQAAIASAEAVGLEPPLVLAVTLLTSIDPQTLAVELKVPLDSNSYVLQMALLARDSGLRGVVCSPQEASQLRRFLPADFILVCPGVRPTWADSQDQRRTMTPVQALNAGATCLVIGRPITAAPDPAAAFARICEECSTAIAP
ncbi:orotidine-5'-phosphate decarboxylase [Phormidium tenue]|uniref:Orotidine 5'-phosphate decarboxylase n=1 Tax=Phormidium tenue NIES-30 TaxID=549789 RepID=A0A1U7J6E7_9CYAN|nr:orotidine-5'-phosphate decarboxylase [Phormidium tenue]MBD2231963.1 orotidine-5'-phosphate decarboxylase [Phormidium tenue FACHB-1052]OKH48439.1 orotidine 5'-phosphate decarboxylase [Phormidium tenue NIES-30]